VEFFEKKIRPVLIEHCYRCHSAAAEKAKKLKGGLLLDSRNGVSKGGQGGPVVIPGKPGESRLLKALRYEGDLKMPPQGKLPNAVAVDFAKELSFKSASTKSVSMSCACPNSVAYPIEP